MAETRINTFNGVITAFGGPAKYAEAIGIEDFHAQTMKTRGSIPSAYWRRTVAAAKKLGIKGITDDKLIDLGHAKAQDHHPHPARARA